MSHTPKSFADAVKSFTKLPSVGYKSGQRMIMHLLRMPEEVSVHLAEALINVRKNLKLCEQCFAYTDEPLCFVCQNPKRDQSLVCVVEDPTDVFAIEDSGQYHGVYHVLHGRLSPLEGIGPDKIKVIPLIERTAKGDITEVILAMNPDVEGDATALYISNKLSIHQIKTSRIAMGVPMGSSLEYTDQVTLGRAIAERRQYADNSKA